MHWLQNLDLALLRFINQTLSNRFFDVVMPFASGNVYFFPAVIVAAILLIWKGGARGRLCVLMLALIVGPGDGLVTNQIKHAVQRPRPFVEHEDILLPGSKATPQLKSVEDKQVEQTVKAQPVRKPAYNSMPSAHSANWFAATMIFFIYFRRSLRIMLPLACIVAFSRLYNGVHYPTDVLAGAILGAGYAAAGVWGINALWQFIGRRWFPLWWQKLPSLTMPDAEVPADNSKIENQKSKIDHHWLRLGSILIAALFIGRLVYIGSGLIELSGDEAYQWVWSKHLALSYYSKPPMIAYTQWLGTHLWGDTAFGVRFFSPVLAAITSLLLLHFLTRHINGRAAVMLVLISSTTPMLGIGSTLMTIDPLSVFFWICAMLAGWRAVQPDGKVTDWLWTGLWMGFGFLSKYTALLQLLCWAVFFALSKPARVHLRRPGPYLTLLVNALCSIPVLIWNSQHKWITVTHVAGNAGLDSHKWNPRTLEFLGVEFALLNPVFFVAMIWAAIAFWRRFRNHAFAIYLFSMGTPLFLCYFLWSFHSRILPNWIAPSILPMFCLMALYWNDRWDSSRHWAKGVLIFGLVFGAIFVAFLHESDLIKKIAGRPLPPKPDPLTRVRAYGESARVVENLRHEFLKEGKPVFIICGHYQHTGLLSFYDPEARTNVTGMPLIYAQRADVPKNQFYFWPGYKEQRRGQNALYVRELGGPPLIKGWVPKWLNGETNLLRNPPKSSPPPKDLLEDFDSVKDLGQFTALYRGRVFHTYQIFECRNLR
ncbi:MAG TPA: glycosyltransferase family 39 protein [Candidatus Paceibacterota bacterium]|nr:glycosyltransferase family 39 protein [Candidatus Paceibacterota bacterium]